MVFYRRELEIDRVIVSNVIIDRNFIDDSGHGVLVVH